jgi:hypothetical protein
MQNCVRLCSNFGYFNNKEQFTQMIQKYIAVVKEIARTTILLYKNDILS